MRTEIKKMTLIIILAVSAFVLTTVPWLLLLFESTRAYVKWLGNIYFQFWGWLIVYLLAGYALKKVRKLALTPKLIKGIIIASLVITLVLASIWFLLILFGSATSSIV